MSLLAISAISAGASALLGAGQLIQGYSRQREANQAAEQAVTDLLKVRERNILAGLQIPTMGAELQERALARATAGQVEAMQEAGAAGVIGGAGRLTQSVGEQAAAQAAEIDRMQKQRDMMVLQQEQEIETRQKGIERGVEQMRLTGAQAEAASAAEQVQAGFGSIASGIALGADLYASGLNPYGTEKSGGSSRFQRQALSGRKDLATGAPKGTTTGIDPNTGQMISMRPGFEGPKVSTTPIGEALSFFQSSPRTQIQSAQIPSLGATNVYPSTYTQGPLINAPVYSPYYNPTTVYGG